MEFSQADLKNKYKEFEKCFNKNEDKNLVLNLDKFIQESAKPLDSSIALLKIAINNRKFFSVILLSIEKWLKKYPDFCISEQNKKLVVELIASSKFTVNTSDRLFDLFQLDQPSIDELKKFINYCIATDKYEPAMYFIYHCKLFSNFHTKTVALRLILLGKISYVRMYMSEGGIAVQREIMLQTDVWIKGHYRDAARYGIVEVPNCVHQKYFVKHLLDWYKQYPKAVKQSELPNLQETVCCRDLNFLFRRFYVEKKISGGACEDLVHKFVHGNSKLLSKACSMISNRWRDYEAVRRLQSKYSQSRDQNTKDHLPVWVTPHDDKEYYESDLSFDKIHVVDSLQKLQLCDQSLFKPSADGSQTLVGFDSEFTNLGMRREVLNIIQLATCDQVYIIDVNYFQNSKHCKNLGLLLEKLFSSEKIIKIGFGTDSDKSLFAKEFPSADFTNFKFMFDLMLVLNLTDYNLFSDLSADLNKGSNKKSDLKGLSKLTYQVFGSTLDKREQISDWERRPLRKSQIKYAALDAYSSLQIYKELSARLASSGVNESLYNLTLKHSQKKNENQ